LQMCLSMAFAEVFWHHFSPLTNEAANKGSLSVPEN
jgi:hypothetical protein